jgi:biopolymer transport protein ExbD
MAIFRTKYSNREATISTAALPDIIFMLLFFFMVTTVLRNQDESLKYMIPQAEQLRSIEQKSLVSQITIGMPKDQVKFGVTPRIEANGHMIDVADIGAFIVQEKDKLPPYSRDQIIIVLKADEEVSMGLLTDVQQELRKANARKIVYAATWKNGTDY